MNKCEDVASHVNNVNPLGRGRPYMITRLVQISEQRKEPPKRLTIDMRLRLDDRLTAAGISSDNVLAENARTTRLWV